MVRFSKGKCKEQGAKVECFPGIKAEQLQRKIQGVQGNRDEKIVLMHVGTNDIRAAKSDEHIYNADESELFWRMLADKTLADLNEKVAPGRKLIKARITFMPCANVTGKHKLPLFVVGKAIKQRAFESVTLPVCYCEHKNAWVTREFFWEWFKTEFVPKVRQHMKSVNLLQRALLLLDNCPGHPSAEELCTNDGEISAMFLPPNSTALIQPMDQNVIQNIKLRYRKLLLTNILDDPAHNENMENALKIEESVQTEEIQLPPLIIQLQLSNPISIHEALQWASEAYDSLARNEILTDDEMIRTIIAEDDNDDTPVNSVKFLMLRLWRHSILQYSRLKSKIMNHTTLYSSDV
ncbi:hypothetical protein J437_LFUL018900 [Ladona fulva]|uniref:DDE-1 domain-containing protein n=1 Tax=Ladona fulva TaxID=123851 RepID=A0A8K0KR76_LADFU|nr:hypothetical protein J437_LFUL018900 [Ladona fulva]